MPGPVWMLLLWHMLGALLVLGSLIRPADTGGFLTVRFGVLGYHVLVVATLLILRDKASENLLRTFVIGNILAISICVATAAQPLGAVTYSLGYALVALYAAFWNSRVFSFVVTATISVSYMVAVISSGRTLELGASWVTISALCITVVVVTGILVAGLEDGAVIDPLTGVMNRLGLQTLAQLLPRAGRMTLPRTLIALDLDGFKAYNDTHGHEAGDYLLKELGSSLRDELHGDDIIARLGGDEFVIVLMRTDISEAQPTIDRLRDASPGSWSAGVIDWPLDERFSDALKRADALLYEEKHKARPLS